MRRKDVLLGALAVLVCLGGTAIAQEQAYPAAGYGFQSSSGLVGGAEMLFLRAYGNKYDEHAHRNLSGDPVAPANDFEIAPRIWLGYVGESGFGVRGRWFQYQHTLKAGTGTFDDPEERFESLEGHNYLDVYAVDVDFMQRGTVGCWEANVGAGLRVGGVKRRTTVDGLDAAGEVEGTVSHTSRFEGVGPTIFAEVKRPIFGTGFSLVANARGSLLFGESRWDSETVLGEQMPDHNRGGSDTMVGVGEIQLGAEYARELGYGTTGFAQGLWEGQLWSNASDLNQMRDDLGLTGVVFNVGITR